MKEMLYFNFPIFKDHVFLYSDSEEDRMFTIFKKDVFNEFCRVYTISLCDKKIIIKNGQDERIPFVLNLYLTGPNPTVHLYSKTKPLSFTLSKSPPVSLGDICFLDYRHPSYQEWNDIILPQISKVIERADYRFKEINDELLELIEDYDYYRFSHEGNIKCI
jgi:hypothetical protein